MCINFSVISLHSHRFFPTFIHNFQSLDFSQTHLRQRDHSNYALWWMDRRRMVMSFKVFYFTGEKSSFFTKNGKHFKFYYGFRHWDFIRKGYGLHELIVKHFGLGILRWQLSLIHSMNCVSFQAYMFKLNKCLYFTVNPRAKRKSVQLNEICAISISLVCIAWLSQKTKKTNLFLIS